MKTDVKEFTGEELAATLLTEFNTLNVAQNNIRTIQAELARREQVAEKEKSISALSKTVEKLDEAAK